MLVPISHNFKMKKIQFIFILAFVSIVTQAQTYQVIKIRGYIDRCNGQSQLKIDTEIHDNDMLCFTNTSNTEFAIAYLIKSNSTKRFILTSKNRSPGIQQNLVLEGLKASRSLVGRRKGKINSITELQTLLGGGDFLILGGKLAIELNPGTLPINDEKFFFVNYEFQGREFNKKLTYDGTTLFLDAVEIYQIDGVPIPLAEVEELELVYYKTDLQKSVSSPVTTFKPKFPLNSEIHQELDIIFNNNKETPQEALKEDMIAYLSEVYGDAEEHNINEWLDNYFKNKRNSHN